MATQDQMLESKYIQKTDLTQPTRLTVTGCERRDIGREGSPDFKWVVEFGGAWKPMILNVTNTKAFFEVLGADSDDWTGKQIVLFNDMSVSFKEGKTGGIRVYKELKVADAASQAPHQSAPVDTTDYSKPPESFPTGNIPF